MRVNNLLKNLPFQLILCLIFGSVGSLWLPEAVMNIIYTSSCFLKDILMIALPYVILSYIWASIVSFGNRGVVLIIATFGLVVVANMVALLTAYGVSITILPIILDTSMPSFGPDTTNSIVNLFSLTSWIPFPYLQPKHGMIIGFIFGIITVLCGSKVATQTFQINPSINTNLTDYAIKMRHHATQFLKKGFIPLLPIYITGFVVKISKDGDILNLLHGYAHTFILICIVLVLHLLFWYGVGSQFKKENFLQSLKNMLPAGITGFTTMSSSATMPVTLDATEKNTQDKAFADFFIPATVNSHLTGDGLSITITAFALLLMTGHTLPSFSVFLLFALQYCLVKFSAAGVPGGGVIVILPVAKEFLGLDDTLTSILQTIYMLQDPILTSTNVMGNGAFALVSHKLMKPFLNQKILIDKD